MALVLLALILAAAVLLQNLLYRKNTFRNLSYRCYFSTPEAYEGDEIELVEEIVNRKLLPVPWLRSDFTASKYLDFAGTRSVVTDKERFVVSFFLLKSYHQVTRRWKVRCTKRGVFPISRVSLVATDLLGNCILSRNIPVSASVTVLPDPTLLEQTEYRVRHLTGDVTVRRHLVSDPFTISGTREYTERDPLNKIDWLATARTRQLMVREYAYTTSPNLAVILNIQSREFERDAVLDEENVENAVRTCAGLFYETLKTGVPVEFLCNAQLPGADCSVSTKSGFGTEHVVSLLRLLARLPLCNCEDFSPYLKHAAPHLNCSDLVIVTSFLSDGILAFAREHSEARILLTGFEEAGAIPDDVPIVVLGGFFRDMASQKRSAAIPKGGNHDGQEI